MPGIQDARRPNSVDGFGAVGLAADALERANARLLYMKALYVANAPTGRCPLQHSCP
jgi:hypothetical protein